jgi:dihydrofolate synthase / folylpolyglutamate synthase
VGFKMPISVQSCGSNPNMSDTADPLENSARHKQAMAFLLGRINHERTLAIPYGEQEFRLDRMRELMARLGNPQDRLRIVHLAGTKGKGSTCVMIAAATTAAGYRTGLYTSPHVTRLEERFMVDGQPCSEEALAELVERVRLVVEQMDTEAAQQSPPQPRPTYFEITTAMAFLHFAVARAELAVIEVGLGGRLDSTNICHPLVTAITSISYDHTQQLGNTLAKIAAEKAGIIKPGVVVVSGVMDEEPRQVIAHFAQNQNCRLVQAGPDFQWEYHSPRKIREAGASPRGTMDFSIRAGEQREEMRGVELGLLGRHQAANAAVALAVLTELRGLGWNLPEGAIRSGLASLNWPARVEVISQRPTVVIDAAHNVASVQALVDTLRDSFHAARRYLVFATTKDKDVRGMLLLLLPHFDAVVLTRYSNNPRAVEVAELDQLAAELSPIPRYLCNDPTAAWQQVRQLARPEDLVCITGSFFLASEMRVEIARHPLQPNEAANNLAEVTLSGN